MEGSAPAFSNILVELGASSCAAKHNGVAPEWLRASTVAPAAIRRATAADASL